MVVPVTSIDMVKQLCTALDAFLGPVYDAAGQDSLPDINELENVFAFCVTWSIGAPLIGASQTQFNEFVKKISSSVTCLMACSLTLSMMQRVRGCRPGKVVSSLMSKPKPFKFYEVIVPTTDSTKFSYLLRELGPRKPVLFVGASGTAKTTIVMDYLESLNDDTSRKLTIGFSSRTSSMDVQKNVEVNVDKRTGMFSAF